MNFVSTTFALIIVIAFTLALAFFAHTKITETENEFIVYKIYVDCIDKNDKQVCQHILSKLNLK